jgi:hypothetical protein
MKKWNHLLMQRILVFMFLVLLSSCGKDDVFVFEGTAEREIQLQPQLKKKGGMIIPVEFYTKKIAADYSIQFTIIEEKVYFIVKLTNRKWQSHGGDPTMHQDRTERTVFDLSSRCYDEHGNTLFTFSQVSLASYEKDEGKGIYKGILTKVSPSIASKIHKVGVKIRNQ